MECSTLTNYFKQVNQLQASEGGEITRKQVAAVLARHVDLLHASKDRAQGGHGFASAVANPQSTDESNDESDDESSSVEEDEKSEEDDESDDEEDDDAASHEQGEEEADVDAKQYEESMEEARASNAIMEEASATASDSEALLIELADSEANRYTFEQWNGVAVSCILSALVHRWATYIYLSVYLYTPGQLRKWSLLCVCSCIPNCHVEACEQHDGTVVLQVVALRDITKGEQLTSSLVPIASVSIYMLLNLLTCNLRNRTTGRVCSGCVGATQLQS